MVAGLGTDPGNNSDLSPDFGFSSVSSTPAGSLSARPAREERSKSALNDKKDVHKHMIKIISGALGNVLKQSL